MQALLDEACGIFPTITQTALIAKVLGRFRILARPAFEPAEGRPAMVTKADLGTALSLGRGMYGSGRRDSTGGCRVGKSIEAETPPCIGAEAGSSRRQEWIFG